MIFSLMISWSSIFCVFPACYPLSIDPSQFDLSIDVDLNLKDLADPLSYESWSLNLDLDSETGEAVPPNASKNFLMILYRVLDTIRRYMTFVCRSILSFLSLSDIRDTLSWLIFDIHMCCSLYSNIRCRFDVDGLFSKSLKAYNSDLMEKKSNALDISMLKKRISTPGCYLSFREFGDDILQVFSPALEFFAPGSKEHQTALRCLRFSIQLLHTTQVDIILFC